MNARTTAALALLSLASLAACSSPAQEPAVSPPGVAAVTPPETPAAAPEVREGFVVGDRTAEGIDDAAFTKLLTKATSQHSEALVIVKNGKLVYEDYFGGKDEPIVAMSASKSFTSLAYGFLVAEGKLASLDELVVKTLPTFAASDPRKAKMTYRHLLTQTSGIDPTRAGGTKGDIEQSAIDAKCVFDPGTSWQYSNAGVDLLAALAGKLAGKPMDQYLNEKLFHPLGIADVGWIRDKNGVPLGAGEMLIRPLDMAKVGQAMLDGGTWRTTAVIPKTWAELSVTQSSKLQPVYGLLWWRDAPVTAVGLTRDVVAQWQTAGVESAILAKVEPLVDQKFADETSYAAALDKALTRIELASLNGVLQAGNHLPYMRILGVGAMRGYNAAGWLGQFLVVVPEKNLVAVRMRRPRDADYGGGAEVDGFPTFPSEVPAIAP